MTHQLFFLFFLALGLGPVFAQTALEPIADQVRAQSLFLPETNSISAWAPSDKQNPKRSYSIKRTFAPDGTFSVEWQDPQFTSSQTFRPDGTLISSRLSDLYTQTVVETKVDDHRSSVRIVTTAKGQVKSDHQNRLTRGMVLREETQNLISQAWLYGVRDGLKFQSLSPDGAFVGDFQIEFKTVADPTSLSTKYTYPEEFKNVLSTRSSYVVADMSLQGVASLFYPHHFYLVYLVTPSGLELTASFGQDPAAPLFETVTRG
jgi:hypothetical protein